MKATITERVRNGRCFMSNIAFTGRYIGVYTFQKDDFYYHIVIDILGVDNSLLVNKHNKQIVSTDYQDIEEAHNVYVFILANRLEKGTFE